MKKFSFLCVVVFVMLLLGSCELREANTPAKPGTGIRREKCAEEQTHEPQNPRPEEPEEPEEPEATSDKQLKVMTWSHNPRPEEPEAANNEQMPDGLTLYTVTAYCSCADCCGKMPTDDLFCITASGYDVRSKEKDIVAADINVLPFGTKVRLWTQEGEVYGEYSVEDTGGAIEGNELDIYYPTHEEALEFGVQYFYVEVID